jgi:Protein of unknown function (DUF1091)
MMWIIATNISTDQNPSVWEITSKCLHGGRFCSLLDPIVWYIVLILICIKTVPINFNNFQYLRRNAVIMFDQIQVDTIEKLLSANGSIDTTRKLVSVYFTPLVDIDGPVNVRQDLWYKENGKYLRVPLVQMSLNICQNLLATNQNPLFKFFFETVRSFGMLPTKCPIKKVSDCFKINSNVCV